MYNEIDFRLPMALLKFLARLGSVTSVTLLLLLFQAEAFDPSSVTPKQWVGLFFFPFGVIVGLIVAWWREGLGVAVTLGSLLSFYLVYGYLFNYHIAGWAFVVFASPAFLFLLHWLICRGEQRRAHV